MKIFFICWIYFNTILTGLSTVRGGEDVILEKSESLSAVGTEGLSTVRGGEDVILEKSESLSAVGIEGWISTTCSAGLYADGRRCRQCREGTRSPAGAKACKICPAGTYSRAASSSCWPCGKGSVSQPKSATCTTCVAGQYANQHEGVCKPCLKDTYSLEPTDACLTCPKGSYSGVGEKECRRCSPGQNFDYQKLSCADCHPSYYSPNPDETCRKCPAGEYSGPRAAECKKCPDGTTAKPDQTGCTDPTPNPTPAPTPHPTYDPTPPPTPLPTADPTPLPTNYPTPNPASELCLEGEYFNGLLHECVTCTAADARAGKCTVRCDPGYGPHGIEPCSPCAVNTFAPDGAKICIPCPLDMVVTDERTKCIYCKASYFRQAYPINPYYQYSKPAECLKCPAGTYSRFRDKRCRKCSPGKTVNADQTGCIVLTPSPTISPTPEPTIAPTASCLHGEYFHAFLGECVTCTDEETRAGECTTRECPEGFGLFNEHPCRSCKVNTYVPEGADTCIACPLDMVVTDKWTKCVYCKPSFYRQAYKVKPWYQYSTPAECLKCPAGTYSGFQDTGCHECPPGQILKSDQTGCTHIPIVPIGPPNPYPTGPTPTLSSDRTPAPIAEPTSSPTEPLTALNPFFPYSLTQPTPQLITNPTSQPTAL